MTVIWEVIPTNNSGLANFFEGLFSPNQTGRHAVTKSLVGGCSRGHPWSSIIIKSRHKPCIPCYVGLDPSQISSVSKGLWCWLDKPALPCKRKGMAMDLDQNGSKFTSRPKRPLVLLMFNIRCDAATPLNLTIWLRSLACAKLSGWYFWVYHVVLFDKNIVPKIAGSENHFFDGHKS